MKATRMFLLSAACITVVTTALPNVAAAQAVDVARTPTWDVLELQDGSLYKGVIVEQSPGQSYKLAMIDGSIRVFAADQVVKILKEANPYAVAPAAPAPAAAPASSAWSGGGQTALASKGMPAPFATTGLRFGADIIIAFPTGNWAADEFDETGIKTSFAPSLRFGYESIKGNIGIGGGIAARFIPWILESELRDAGVSVWSLEAHAYGRASLHVGKFSPYLGLTMGVDSAQANGPGNDDDTNETGFGMNLDFGFEAFVSNTIALGLGGSAKLAGPDFGNGFGPKYFGLRVGMTTHF